MNPELRKRQAAVLHKAAVDALTELNLLWKRRPLMQPTEFYTAIQAACAKVNATLSDQADFGAMCDADAELEFDGAPDTQEQVTTPRGAER